MSQSEKVNLQKKTSTKQVSKASIKTTSFNPVWGDAAKKEDKVSEDLEYARERWGPPKQGKPKTNYMDGEIGIKNCTYSKVGLCGFIIEDILGILRIGQLEPLE